MRETPLTLELGGKNPCIVDRTCNIQHSAARICWGRNFNCGQICIAPEYVLIPSDMKDEFVDLYIKNICKHLLIYIPENNLTPHLFCKRHPKSTNKC